MQFCIDIPKKVYDQTLKKAIKNPGGMTAEQWIQDMVTGALQAHMEAGDFKRHVRGTR